MQLFTATKDVGDVRFTAKLTEDGDRCYEVVTMFEPGKDIVYVHSADFATSNLGAASRSQYVATMLASVIADRKRRGCA